MRPETKTILDDLKNTQFFLSVGEPVKDKNVIGLKSWKQAIKSAKKIDWQNLKLEWGNILSGTLAVQHTERFQNWNNVAIDMKTYLMPIVDEKVAALGLPEDLGRRLHSSVAWDLLSLLMESEYSDLVKPYYYAALGVIYFDGHFPCGWEGEYPKGKLVVY